MFPRLTLAKNQLKSANVGQKIGSKIGKNWLTIAKPLIAKNLKKSLKLYLKTAKKGGFSFLTIKALGIYTQGRFGVKKAPPRCCPWWGSACTTRYQGLPQRLSRGPGGPWAPLTQGKKKTHKHKQICGIVPGLGGCQKFVYVFFFRVIPYGGEKTHKQNSTRNPGTIP